MPRSGASVVDLRDLPPPHRDRSANGVPSRERELVTWTWNLTRRHPLADRALPDLLRETAAARPGAPAVVADGQVLDFATLLRRAGAVAARLRARGVRTDDVVGVLTTPSADLVVAVWGVLLSGAAYLPLSPDYPRERLRFMVADAAAATVLVDTVSTELGDRIVDDPDALLPIHAPAGDTAPGDDPGPRPAPNDLAYVLHTSGSTGRPKGVMVEHRAVVNQLRWLHAEQGLDTGCRILQKTPVSFDAAQWEILAGACGATVVVGRSGLHRDPERLLDRVQRHGVTTVQVVPTLLRALVDTGRLSECTSLTGVFSGAEALSRALAQDVLDALPDARLVNLYGPSECTINSSAFEVDRDALAEGPQQIPIGTPVHNTQYYVLDDDGAPVAPGEVGELYIGGIQLARGYIGRPDLTAERFVRNPFRSDFGSPRLYRTGDLVSWNADGTVAFVGRTDNQVKLRGFRIELDEVTHAVEQHDWVRHAAAVVRTPAGGGRDRELVVFVELDPHEATLMDQGVAADHHRSKDSRVAIRAQLSGAGRRSADELDGRPALDLPGRPDPEARRHAFARKTYRFFDGGRSRLADLERMLSRPRPSGPSRAFADVTADELGALLRRLGPFTSPERLLPKYAYASPGALYAVQVFLDSDGDGPLPAGVHYLDTAAHRLVRVGDRDPALGAGTLLHLVGRPRAIEDVYRTNVREVVELEAGHLVGLLEETLPSIGLGLADLAEADGPADLVAHVGGEPGDHPVGTFSLVPHGTGGLDEHVDVYLQSHPRGVDGLRPGLHAWTGDGAVPAGDDVVRRREVIAINQQVYDRAGFGVWLVARHPDPRRRYVDLGRRLHHLQDNDADLGLMSSGYSSESGHPLPSSTRMDAVLAGLGLPGGPTYFALGGRVSAEQIAATGMREDAVHMKGPTELIREDLLTHLPDYMMPHRVVVLPELPLTANGKIDSVELATLDLDGPTARAVPAVAPRTPAEARLATVWASVTGQDEVSVVEDFFAAGGNSLTAVALVHGVEREFGRTLPMQAVFESPTVEQLAARLGDPDRVSSRLVSLRPGDGPPVICWPGLGGYPMNLRGLAEAASGGRPVAGMQAYGLNPGEEPYPTVGEMAVHDVELIRRRQPHGPYTLWGYSFGARVAFEAAHRLERAGERVEQLVLIAPGAPREGVPDPVPGPDAFADPHFTTILYSVFAGTVHGPDVHRCREIATDEASFVDFVTARTPGLAAELARRIVRVVHRTYRFEYTFAELASRRIAAPVTVVRARGDDYSFIDAAGGWSVEPPAVIDLDVDHYALLRGPGLSELARVLRPRTADGPA